MNALCYKIVFSKRLGTLVAVGEHTVGQGKTASGSGVRNVVNGAVSSFIGALNAVFAAVALTFLTASFTASVSQAAGPAANALPSGASVNSGSVAISSTSSSNAAVMNITQSTDKASVNWNSFNIGSAARVNVQQNSASSVLLNRVVGNDPSQIFGKLSANGQVILINPNGIVFGSGGSVTASAFTASTFGLSEQDFANNKYKFTRSGSAAGVTVKEGATLNATAPGGYIALIGASVDNQGRISTQQGAVVLAAGESVALPASLTNNISVPLSGKVRLELLPSTINAMVSNSGTITTEGGQVLMQAAALSDAVASITHTGTIDTTGAQGGAVTVLADGGVIKATGSITANSLGKDEHGQLRKGGDIIIGRDEETSVLAKTADVSGANLETKGGFIETSGHDLKIDGVHVKAANWLLDPDNIDITNGTAASGYSKISATTLSSALTSGTNVTVNTTGGVSGASSVTVTGTSAAGSTGNIKVTDAITKTTTGDATLNLIADDSITLKNSITSSGTGAGKLNINLTAANTISGTGNLSANGGNITLTNTNSASTVTLSGSIAAAQLTKAGAGKIIQTGALTTSAVNVNGGTWQIGDGTTNGSVAIASGPAVAFGIASGATLAYNVKTGTTHDTVSSTYTGTGTLLKKGGGALQWNTNDAKGTFEMSAGGWINVAEGVFTGSTNSNEVWTANKSNLNVATNATFNGVEGAINVDALTGGGTVSSGWSGKPYALNVGVNNGSGVFSGVIQDANGQAAKLTKWGTGTQILTGANAYTGTTTINGGTLQIGDGVNSGTLNPTGSVILNNGNLSYLNTVNTNINNAISGTGNVTAKITNGGNLTVSKAINLTSGNIYLQSTAGSISTGTAAALTGTNISLDNTGGTINTTTGAITSGSSTGIASNGVATNAALTANNGNISIAGVTIGNTDPTGYGVQIKAALLTNGSGDITIDGVSNNLVGFNNTSAGSITAAGALKITGTMKNAGGYQGANIAGNLTGASVYLKGTSNGHYGVQLTSNVTSTVGDIYIEGNASNTAAALGQNVSSGARTSGIINAKGKATIKGTTSAAGLYQGLIVSNVVKGSSVELIGNSVKDLGVDLKNTGLITATNGSVTITGTSGTSDAVRLGVVSTLSNTTTITATGDVDITGTAGNSSLDQSGTTGVRLYDGVTITAGNSTTSGTINITGTVDTQTGKSGNGVDFQRFPTAARLTATGDININGTVTGAGGGSGVSLTQSGTTGQAPMMNAGGNFILRGNNRAASGTGNGSAAINGGSGIQVTAVGDIVIQAETQNAAVNSINFTLSQAAFSGNASFKSSSGNVLIQANQGAINFSNGLATTGVTTAPYTSLTDISGKNITFDNTGAGMAIGAGTAVTGSGGTQGASIANGGSISTTGVIVKGSGTSTYASGGAITLNSSVGLAITASENVNIATVNNGATQSGLYTGATTNISGKNVTIDGTSLNSNGVYTNGAITATSGDVSITGTSTGAPISPLPQTASALSLQGAITAYNNVAIVGNNTNTSNGAAVAFLNKTVTATNGKIDITTSTQGATASALQLASVGSLSAKTEVNIKTDTLSIDAAASIKAGASTPAAPTGTVTIKTDSSTGKIDIGAGDAGSATTSARTLGLTNAELNRITAANLVIGDANNTGGLKVSAATTTNTTTGNLTLQTSGGMSITGALTAGNSTLKDITLLAKSSGTGLRHQALVKGDNITIQAESTATTGNILGYHGDGSAGQFDAKNSLNLTGVTASTGNGFYSFGGTYKAGTGITITGTSANGQGVGFDGNAKLTNTTSGDIIIKGTASDNAATNNVVNAKNTQGIGLRGVAIQNAGGKITLEALKGQIYSDTGNSGWGLGPLQNTITQNGTGDVKLTTVGNGNINVPLIVNNGAGNVVIAAGSDLSTGDGTGGQVKTVAGNSITHRNTTPGTTYIYSGNATDTSSLSAVGGFANGLFLSTIGSDFVNAASNTEYKTIGSPNPNMIAGGAKAQVMFREKVALSGALNNATVTYGDSTNSAAVKAALQATNIGASNVISTTSNAGTFKILNADLIADIATGKPSVDTALSLATNKSTSGNLKANSAGYGIDIAGTKYTLNTTAKLVVNKRTLDSVAIVAAGNTFGDTVGAGAVTFGNTKGTGAAADKVTLTADVVSTAGNLSTSSNLKASTYTQKTTAAKLAGDDSGNYTVVDTTTSTANYTVGKRTLDNVAIAATGNTYGETVAAGAVTFGNTKGTGATADKVTLTADVVSTASDLSTSSNLKASTYTQKTTAAKLAGDDSGNYTVVDTTTSTANYTVGKKALTISGITTSDKTYNGDAVAAVVTTGLVKGGLVVSDDVTVSSTGKFRNDANTADDKNVKLVGGVVQAKTVALNNSYGGADKDNYAITDQTTTNAKITQKPLTAIYTATDKVFDGNTNSTVTGVLKDILIGDSVTATHTSATFDTAAVGTNKTVTVAGIALTGGDASNYKIDPVVNLGNTATAKANITAAASIPPAPVVPTSASSSGRVKIPTPTANPFQLASAEELGEEDFCSDGSSGNSNSSCTCEESKLAQDAQICFEKNTQKISAQ